MKAKQNLIDLIKENIDKIGINLDCSRFEESYGGYCDSRDWWMKYCDNEISLDKYLSGISINKLEKMANLI